MKANNLMYKIVVVLLSILVSTASIFTVSSYIDSGNTGTSSFTEVAYGKAKDTYEQRGADTYYHFDPAHIFDENGQGDSKKGIAGGAVTIIDFIITKIGLPLGIIMSTWRIAYLAIFPLMMGMDPLGLATSSKGRYKGAQKGKSDSYQEKSDNWAFNSNPLQGLQANRNAASGGGFSLGSTEGDVSHISNAKDTGANTSMSYTDFINNNRVQENVVNYIKQELKFMILGLFITFAVWGLLRLCMMAAMAFLNIADSTATQMT